MAINGYSPITSSLYTPGVNSASQSLASGQRINQTADDAAGQAVVTSLTSQINTQDMATRNANSGISALQTVDGASESIATYLQRMNELAIQSANGTLNNSQRSALNQEFQQNLQGINQVAESTSFNNQNLLNGDTASLNIALGDSTTTLNLPNLTSNGLAINGLDISNPTGATSALGSITTALEQISTQRGEFGAQQNGLSSAINNIQSQNSNAYAARSQINDSDYARSITEQVRQNILQDSAVAMQGQSNQSRASVLQLLNS
ncbi:flagellin [Thiomicrorhabdus immobilis]|uniref:Flagellin n=1 Tax=Thiomicrorhabdus immobilis TaxID=2791037 RepID=A0ABM7MBV2_9GAMM|nr:flagellin [Thiomicrorhabdus immobilis]BCN92827.1 flagellin [Thiomicrorhabdus immobilis]